MGSQGRLDAQKDAKERNETLKLIKDLNATLKGIEQIQIKEFNKSKNLQHENI